MALDEAPPFWWKKPDWRSWSLYPASYLYGVVTAARMDFSPSYIANVPVICIGNFIVGGGGKTPTVQLFTQFLISEGWKPGILSRGHGGAISGTTVVDTAKHTAFDVGDEALLHAELATTVISSDRPKGARILEDAGCDIIVMDDGFQNPSLHKDFRLVVIDSKRGLGNGFAMPAGPLRVPLGRQIRHTDALLAIGDKSASQQAIRKVARAGKPVYEAAVRFINAETFKGKRVLAFAGIADPTKLFDTLQSAGAEVVLKRGFGDHHVFTEEECSDLLENSKEQGLMLVTTTKDHARLRDLDGVRGELGKAATAVQIELVPEDPKMLTKFLQTALRRVEARALENH